MDGVGTCDCFDVLDRSIAYYGVVYHFGFAPYVFSHGGTETVPYPYLENGVPVGVLNNRIFGTVDEYFPALQAQTDPPLIAVCETRYLRETVVTDIAWSREIDGVVVVNEWQQTTVRTINRYTGELSEVTTVTSGNPPAESCRPDWKMPVPPIPNPPGIFSGSWGTDGTKATATACHCSFNFSGMTNNTLDCTTNGQVASMSGYFNVSRTLDLPNTFADMTAMHDALAALVNRNNLRARLTHWRDLYLSDPATYQWNYQYFCGIDLAFDASGNITQTDRFTGCVGLMNTAPPTYQGMRSWTTLRLPAQRIYASKTLVASLNPIFASASYSLTTTTWPGDHCSDTASDSSMEVITPQATEYWLWPSVPAMLVLTEALKRYIAYAVRAPWFGFPGFKNSSGGDCVADSPNAYGACEDKYLTRTTEFAYDVAYYNWSLGEDGQYHRDATPIRSYNWSEFLEEKMNKWTGVVSKRTWTTGTRPENPSCGPMWVNGFSGDCDTPYIPGAGCPTCTGANHGGVDGSNTIEQCTQTYLERRCFENLPWPCTSFLPTGWTPCDLCSTTPHWDGDGVLTTKVTLTDPWTYADVKALVDYYWTSTCASESLMAEWQQDREFSGRLYSFDSNGDNTFETFYYEGQLDGAYCSFNGQYLESLMSIGPVIQNAGYKLTRSTPNACGTPLATCTGFTTGAHDITMCVRPENTGTEKVEYGTC